MFYIVFFYLRPEKNKASNNINKQTNKRKKQNKIKQP